MGEAVEGLNGLVNLSGSKRGKGEKVSGLPPVRVLFPAPFAPAMSVKTGGVTARQVAHWNEACATSHAALSPQGAADPLPALFSLPPQAVERTPANPASYSQFNSVGLYGVYADDAGSSSSSSRGQGPQG